MNWHIIPKKSFGELRHFFLPMVFFSMIVATGVEQDRNSIASDMFHAIQKEDVEGVKSVLATAPDAVNFRAEKGFTMLHLAAQHGSTNGLAVLRLLLAGGAKVEVKNHIGQTAIFGAVIHGNVEGTKILIAHGATVNARQMDGRTPLHWAAGNGDANVAKTLTENGARIDARDVEKKTPLQVAIEARQRYRLEYDMDSVKRYEETIQLLRKSGAKN